MLHKNIDVPEGIHIIQAWEVADEAARLALVLAAGDIGKVCLQQDTKKYYLLTALTPVWELLNIAGTDDVAEGSTNLYHTAARVLATVLTGLSTAAGTVVDATHTILEAIGFLQKQVSDNALLIAENANDIVATDAIVAAHTAAINTNTVDIAALENLQRVHITVACSDETTAIALGVAKTTFRMPCALTNVTVRGSLTVAQVSGTVFTVDINEAGVSILSTKLTFDNTEKTTTTAAIPAVVSDAALADDAEITIDVDQTGDGTAKGLKITISGYPV